MQTPKFLTSSVNPEQLGLTVRGILTAIVPVILILSGLANVNVGQEQASQFVEAIVNIVIAFTTLVSAITIFVGMVRKILVATGIIKVNSATAKPSNPA